MPKPPKRDQLVEATKELLWEVGYESMRRLATFLTRSAAKPPATQDFELRERPMLEMRFVRVNVRRAVACLLSTVFVQPTVGPGVKKVIPL